MSIVESFIRSNRLHPADAFVKIRLFLSRQIVQEPAAHVRSHCQGRALSRDYLWFHFHHTSSSVSPRGRPRLNCAVNPARPHPFRVRAAPYHVMASFIYTLITHSTHWLSTLQPRMSSTCLASQKFVL